MVDPVQAVMTEGEYGRVFANHWEFVRYAQEQHLDLDLTSPSKRWRRP